MSPIPHGVIVYTGQQETFETRLTKVKTDVYIQQDEKPSTAVIPEDLPGQPVRPQCPDLVPADESDTPKVMLITQQPLFIYDHVVFAN